MYFPFSITAYYMFLLVVYLLLSHLAKLPGFPVCIVFFSYLRYYFIILRIECKIVFMLSQSYMFCFIIPPYIQYILFFLQATVLSDYQKSLHVNRQRITGHGRNSRSLNKSILAISKDCPWALLIVLTGNCRRLN
jgi:hypothetical protein